MSFKEIAVVFCVLSYGAIPAYADIITIDGVVKSVDAQKRTITIETGTKEKTLDISSKVKVLIDKEEAGLDSLVPGQNVSLSYHDQLEVVVKIEGVSDSSGEDDEIVLFNGKTLKDWNFHAPRNQPSTIQECWVVDAERQVLVCLGNGFNWIETNKKFQDFKAVFEWRFPPGRTITRSGSGFTVRSFEGNDPKSLVPNGIEVQIGDGTSGDFFSIGTSLHTDHPYPGRKDLFLRKMTSEKPIGEWNTMEVSCKGDRIAVTLNGVLVNEGEDIARRAGRICLLSQNSQIEFRNIRLKSE